MKVFEVEFPDVGSLKFVPANAPSDGLIVSEVYTWPLLSRVFEAFVSKNSGHDSMPRLLVMWQEVTGPFDVDGKATLFGVEPSLLYALQGVYQSGWEPDLSRVQGYGGERPVPFRGVLKELISLLNKAKEEGHACPVSRKA